MLAACRAAHSLMKSCCDLKLPSLARRRYIVYDVQMLMGGHHQCKVSPDEYVFAAINIYLDIINLVSRMEGGRERVGRTEAGQGRGRASGPAGRGRTRHWTYPMEGRVRACPIEHGIAGQGRQGEAA